MAFEIKHQYITGPVEVKLAKYGDETTAVSLFDDEGLYGTVSVCLVGHGVTLVAPRRFWAKAYSEGEGMPEALEAAGIAVAIWDQYVGPFNSRVVLMQLNESIPLP